MDAFVLARLAAVLTRDWAGAWVQGVWEDTDGRLLLRLRQRGHSAHLLLSPSPAVAGVGTVRRRPRCPPRPTALAAYLRAHARGRLAAAACPPYERVLRLELTAGSHAVGVVLDAVPGMEGLYATDASGVIRAVGVRRGGRLRLRAGDHYVLPPPPAERHPPARVGSQQVATWLQQGERLQRHLLGVGAVLATEVQHRSRAGGVAAAWTELLSAYATPGCLWRYPDLLSAVPLTHRQDLVARIDDALGGGGEWLLRSAARLRESTESSLREQQWRRLRKKLQRRIANIEADIAALPDLELERRRADALAAALHAVPPGARWVEVADPGDPEQTHGIALDAALTPGRNLDVLYRRVGKLQRTQVALAHRLAQSREELEAGPPQEVGSPSPAGGRAAGGSYRRYRSSDGWSIWAGRNAGENDRLLRECRPWDVWLHAREAAGAHVVIRKPGRESRVPERTLWEAAGIAALYSRRAAAAKAEVMVVELGRVRKPKGAGPGKVVVAGEQTLYVSPGAGKARLEGAE